MITDLMSLLIALKKGLCTRESSFRPQLTPSQHCSTIKNACDIQFPGHHKILLLPFSHSLNFGSPSNHSPVPLSRLSKIS
jgi:hypothetical protein